MAPYLRDPDQPELWDLHFLQGKCFSIITLASLSRAFAKIQFCVDVCRLFLETGAMVDAADATG